MKKFMVSWVICGFFVIRLLVISISATRIWFTCGIFLAMIVLDGGCHFSFCGFFFFGWLIRGISDGSFFTTWNTDFRLVI